MVDTTGEADSKSPGNAPLASEEATKNISQGEKLDLSQYRRLILIMTLDYWNQSEGLPQGA